MEYEELVWEISIIALVAGVLIGVLGYRLFGSSKKQAEEVQAELDAAREELDKYKTDVSQHFDRTAELVNDLAQNYVNVYQHLADGAQTLGASKSFNELYGQGQGNPAIGVDDPSKESETIDEDAPVAQDEQVETSEKPDEQVDTSEKPDEQPDDSEKPVEDADSSAEKADEKVESAESKENVAEPKVAKSTDDTAETGQSAQDSESPEKVGKH